MPTNEAAWLKARNARPLVVGPASYTSPGPDQIVVRNRAVAINPVDCSLQVLGQFVLTFLKHPLVPGGDLAGEVVKPPTSRSVLITGGASSVGCNAIQLAAQAGYTVVTTASPKNYEYVKPLGAAHVYDYRSKTLQDDLVSSLQGDVVGALAVGDGAVELCMKVLAHIPGSRRFVSMAGSVMVPPKVNTLGGKLSFIGSALWQDVRTQAAGRSTGVRVKFVDTKDLLSENCVVGRDIFGTFLPAALEARQYVTAPRTKVVGHGLGDIQKAMDVQRNGVSAEKVVVTL